jgi:hypothetical protein
MADVYIRTAGMDFQVEDANGPISKDQYAVKFQEYNLSKGSGIDIQYGYSYIELSEPAEAPMGYITCYNGYGLMEPRPILFLLNFGNYKISSDTYNILASYPMEMSVLNTASDSVMKIVKERLMLQTPYILYFKHGVGRLMTLSGIPTGYELGIGSGLSSFTGTSIEKTELSAVINALEIEYKRNIFSTQDISAAQLTYVMDRYRCPNPVLADKLEASEKQYGRRYSSMQFADVITNDGNVPSTIPIIAEAILGNTYKEHASYPYSAPMYPGFFIPLNASLSISDPTINLDSINVRLIQKKISTSNGLTLTFQTE